jgi:WD40 repeat protein
MWFYDVSGDEPRVLFRLDRQAEACRFSSDGRTVVTHEDVYAGRSPTFDVWTLGPDGATFRFRNRPVPPGSVELPSDNIDSFAVSPDGRLAMTGHLNGALRFWDLTGNTLREHQPITPNLSGHVVTLPGRIGTQTQGAGVDLGRTVRNGAEQHAADF